MARAERKGSSNMRKNAQIQIYSAHAQSLIRVFAVHIYILSI